MGHIEVLVWWAAMSIIAVVNLSLWALSARAVLRDQRPGVARYRQRQLMLSFGFVLGCALRSWFLRADVQRLCMVDSFIGSVLVGRSIATVAELCFVAQWALLVEALATRDGNRVALGIARAFLPTIAVAETCSWYAVLTTNYLGNAIEESLWTFTASLFVLSLLALSPAADRSRRRFIGLAAIVGIAYVAFMSTVDVPMYLSRWRADEAAGRRYLSLAEGLRDAMRWTVTLRWEHWREEVPWMSLYFSAATWISLALVHEPALGPTHAVARRRVEAVAQDLAGGVRVHQTPSG